MSYITIYFDDKPVFLCDEITKEINEYRHHPDAVFMDEISTPGINSLLHEINKERFHAGIIFGKDLSKLKKQFFKHFHVIQAGGGLVKNIDQEILLIFRLGKWDLPKGKLDENESIEECALREVSEETGLTHLKIIRPLEVTYHTYVLFGKHNLKETHWFEMSATKAEKLIPQTEEDITEIKWVKKEELSPFLLNTFPTIATVLKHS